MTDGSPLVHKPRVDLSPPILLITATRHRATPYIHGVIIEAGYDIKMLLAPKLLRRRRVRDSTWVLVLDENLRFHDLVKIRASSEDPAEVHAREIRGVLMKDSVIRTKHYAVGTLTTGFTCIEDDRYGSGAGHLDSYTSALRTSPLLADFELLGFIHSNGEHWCTDLPRYSFRDYVGLEHLPRSESFDGPHSFGNDCCPACERFEQRLARNRANFDEIEGLEKLLDD